MPCQLQQPMLPVARYALQHVKMQARSRTTNSMLAAQKVQLRRDSLLLCSLHLAHNAMTMHT